MAITNAQQAKQLQQEGGPMRKIKGQDHMLAYITPNEADKLVKLGGQETMTPEGILAYPEFDNYTEVGGGTKSQFEGGGGYEGVGSSNDGVIQQYNTPKEKPPVIPKKKPKKTKDNYKKSSQFTTPTLAAFNFLGNQLKNSKFGQYLNTKAREDYLENLKEDDPDLYQATVDDLAKLGYATRDVEIYGPKGKQDGPMAPGRDIETFTDLYEDQAKSILNTVRDSDDGGVGTLYDDYLDSLNTPTGGGGGDNQVMDPCLGPNPPAYCFVNNDPTEEDATPDRNLGGLAPRFAGSIFDFTGLAEGGRVAAQQGGIMPRLNDLSGDVSSAEQMLQEINQRLQSAESTLGEGGGGTLANLASSTPPVQTPDPFFGKGGELRPLELAGATTQQPAFGSMEEAYSSFQDKAKDIRAGGMLGRVVLPGEMSFENFSNNMNLNTGFFGMHGAGGVPAGGNNMQSPLVSLQGGLPGGAMGSPLQQAVGLANGGRAGMMDGGMMDDDPTGGIMDLESGRQMYFLGKLVKKATRAVKKVAKSPFGKAALGAALFKFGGGFGGGSGKGLSSLLSKGGRFLLGTKGVDEDGGTMGLLGKLGLTGGFGGFKPTLKGGLALGLGIPFALDALGVGKKDDEGFDIDEYYRTGGINIADIRNNPYNYLSARNQGSLYAADGGLMRTGYQEGGDAEPVAKKTMPLLDMDGMEKDYREDGGFVPIGRMERADDVPARLSKNEFVFTADAVRNAGEGDIDKGAEVMYNMMKNLESGGEVSEESQGLDGAREMFKTSQRLEEVL